MGKKIPLGDFPYGNHSIFLVGVYSFCPDKKANWFFEK